MNEKNLEDIDFEILKILGQDGRETYHSISKKLDKSPVTIKRHVSELEDSGIIKNYGATIDYEKVGFTIVAVIELTTSKGKMIEMEKKVAENPNVFAVYDITGTYDALILARFKDRSELSAMIKEMHKYPEVERTNTHLILNVIKEESSLGKLIK
jgi:Lrp/AsnC family transcriptional regulator, leucine-responsive regulatory protein